MDSLALAKKLRAWQEDHPVLDFGLGLVPGVGQLYGTASSAAAMRDPDASGLEKTMAAASILPVGKIADKVRKIMVSSTLARNIPGLKDAATKADKLASKGASSAEIEKATDGKFYKDPFNDEVMTELDDPKDLVDWQMLDLAEIDKAPTSLGDVFNHPELYKADESLRHVNVDIDPAYLKAEKAAGMYRGVGSGTQPRITLENVPPPWSPTLKDRYARILGHETQHATDDTVGLLDPVHTGRKYWESPDEMRARVAAERLKLTQAGRDIYPPRQHLLDEQQRVWGIPNDDDLRAAPDWNLEDKFRLLGHDIKDYVK